MKNEIAAQTLTRYNEWRRGAEIEQPDPTEIGLAIDAAIRALKNNNLESIGKAVYLPNKKSTMKIQIKKGVNPIGTKFKVPKYFFGQDFEGSTQYKVIGISGAESHTPQNGDIVVHLEATERRTPGIPLYFSLILSRMHEEVWAVSDEDVFWEFKGKTNVSNARQVELPDNE